MDFGAQVRKLRQRRNLTLQEVSRRTGLSIAFLSQLESNQRLPSWETLSRLHRSLKLSQKELLRLLVKLIKQQELEGSDQRTLKAVFLTVGRYHDPTNLLNQLKAQIHPIIQEKGFELKGPISITGQYGPKLERIAWEAALILDGTGLFRNPWGTRRYPFTHAGLVAASYNLPYLLFSLDSEQPYAKEHRLLVSGWINLYRITFTYFSENFSWNKDERLLTFLRDILEEVKKRFS